MFKNIVERFIKKRASLRNKEIILVGTCLKSTEDDYLFFEEAEQAIEYAYYWYSKTDLTHTLPMKNGGYFPILQSNIVDVMEFSRYIQSLFEKSALPVVFSNNCESFTECIADYDRCDVGVININHRIDLVNSMSFIPMQGFVSILTQKPNTSMISVGVFEDIMTATELNLAKSLGVKWMNSASFYSTSALNLFNELEEFLFKHEVIALNIDLKTIVRGMTIKPPFAMDLELLLSAIKLCMHSKKVIFVHLTGENEALIFSKEVKAVLDVIRTKVENSLYAA
ncbi:hypothetical protein [Vibrio algarum]|uniref:Pterin-binding domain-containing protein n=1 Tax=Vibrio algarum TaxID=3020714 RepID=A0ABT4YUE3_9VIBR|nr:hypothetical protein [Vibrio sp. KJ40-1]MDB1125195.1 hypothetical protein [Vibrio sp. KJ40-1]